MTKRQPFLIIATMAIGLGLNFGAWAQSSAPRDTSTGGSVEAAGSATELTIHGKIVDVNKAKKLITLEGPEGRKVALSIENPHNLAAAKVGEPVVARFYEVAVIRKKEPNESIPSASVKEGIATAVLGGVPGGAVTGQVSIVVTVVAIDQAAGTITVKGPDEAVETVKARYPKRLKLLKVGDELVVSVSRAIVLSMEKE
jgi:hypothetical protein